MSFDDPGRAPTAQTSRSQKTTVSKGDEPPTIIVVDDDESDMKAVSRALRRKGLAGAFRWFNDGISALAALRSQSEVSRVGRPLLILLDIKMPLMSGFEFLDVLRAEEALRDHVVFVLSTSEDPRDVRSAYSRHVAGYISKAKIGGDPDLLGGLLSRYLQAVSLPSEKGERIH